MAHFAQKKRPKGVFLPFFGHDGGHKGIKMTICRAEVPFEGFWSSSVASKGVLKGFWSSSVASEAAFKGFWSSFVAME